MSTDEAASGSILGGINKLRGTQNYQDWKFQVKNYLELPGYRSRGPGLVPGAIRFSEK
jgi:hypothetical protein